MVCYAQFRVQESRFYAIIPQGIAPVPRQRSHAPLKLYLLGAFRLERESAPSDSPRAKSNHRSDLFADFYDDWVLQQRESLRTLHVEKLLRLSQELRASEQFARARDLAQKILSIEPTNDVRDRVESMVLAPA